MYRFTYILHQVKGINPGMIQKLNKVAAHPPEEVGVHNGNEGIIYE